MWRMGDDHECPVRPWEHMADSICTDYAVAHADKDYVSELLRCACGKERLESSGTTVITDTDEHRVTLCRELPDRRKAHARVCQCSEVVILDGRPNRMDGGWLHTVDGPCCELKPVVDLKFTDYLPAPDMVNHPPHYKDHPSGVECVTIAEGFNYNKGNAIKYIWRAGKKSDAMVDLKKARWYIDREITRVQAEWDARDRTGES